MRIAIAGARGRISRMLIEAIIHTPDMQLAAVLDHDRSKALGQDAGTPLGRQTGITVTHDLDEIARAKTDCLIDFTHPSGTHRYLAACRAQGVNMVIGTTGFSAQDQTAITHAAQEIAIVYAPNMSIGVNVTLKLLELAARLLPTDYDIEVFEAHHRNKIDAPSGTALKMGETVAAARGVALKDVATWARHGNTGIREPGSIGFSVVRGGDIVGDHTVFFCGAGERIEITHRSNNRAIYVQGSLRAAAFLHAKTSGLYSMQDVLEEAIDPSSGV